MRGPPQPPAGFALLDPPPALLSERAPSNEEDWQPHGTRDGRFAGPLSSIDEIERMAREVAEYWAAMPEPVGRAPERQAESRGAHRGGRSGALPLLDTSGYRRPDFFVSIPEGHPG